MSTPPPCPIRVLIVEDSEVALLNLREIFATDPDMHVAGVARDGHEALELVAGLHPDVVVMDILMPGMDGLTATRTIMETLPTPIVVLTGLAVRKGGDVTFQALEAGAVAVFEKPADAFDADREVWSRAFLSQVRTYAGVKLVRRWPRRTPDDPVSHRLSAEARAGVGRPGLERATPPRAIAIGASTGGPAVIRDLLARLSPEISVPVFVVQHMTRGFMGGFRDWLAQTSLLTVCLPEDGDPALPGRVYLAPDGFQMGVADGPCIALATAPPENGMCPSVSYLFRSVAVQFRNEAVAVLLTGMGQDGARELGVLRDLGAVTIAQDPDSAVVAGMPGEAIRRGAARHVLAPDRIAELLNVLSSKRRND